MGSCEFVQAKEEAEKQLSRVLAPRIASLALRASFYYFFLKITTFSSSKLGWFKLGMETWKHALETSQFVPRLCNAQVDRVYQQVALPSDAWSGETTKMVGSSWVFGLFGAFWGYDVTQRA